MSGSQTGKSPRSDAEWAREVNQRLRSLEQSVVARIGQWTLYNTGTSLLAARPGQVVALDTTAQQSDLSAATAQLNKGITAASRAAAAAQSTANTALADATSGNNLWTELLAALGLSDVPGLSAWLSTAETDAANAIDNWTSFLATIAQGTAEEAADLINTIETDASTALANWTSFLAAVAAATVADAATLITDAQAWLARLIQDVIVLLDVFHLTYQLGSPSDSITQTGSNGKLTWHAAWNNLMDLFGLAFSQSALTDPTPTTGDVINTKLDSTSNLDASKLTNMANHPTLSGSKVTGIANDIVTDLQDHLDNVVSKFLNVSVSGSSLADAATAMSGIQDTVASTARAVQALLTTQQAGGSSGRNYQVDFTTYPAGSFSQCPFDVSYTGLGTGYIEIANNEAYWYKVANGDCIAFALYDDGTNTTTDTDYQWAQATVAAPMDYSNGVSASNSLVLRCDATGQNYVYARGYRAGLFGAGFYAELGCVVGGVTTVFDTGVPAGYNLNLGFKAGVAGVANRFQVFSGDTPVIDYTDSGNVSQIGANYRRWGFISSTGNNGNAAPAPATYIGCADTATPSVTGTTFRRCRTGTGVVTFTSGNNLLGGTFFDSPDYITDNMAFDTGAGKLTVGKQGNLHIDVAVLGNGGNPTSAQQVRLLLYKNNGIFRSGRTVCLVPSSTAGALGAFWGFQETFMIPVAANDYLQLGYNSTATISTPGMTGEASGTQTWWDAVYL